MVAREITHMTSHLDIPATLLPILGVTNPPEDYSLGFNLFGNGGREFTVLCDWDTIAYVDQNYKAVFPLKVYGFAQQRVTTKDDLEIEDRSSFYEKRKTGLLSVMRGMVIFSRQATT
jgi:membrane-anchored protein YejM (alkaline phosphatase superfamily)